MTKEAIQEDALEQEEVEQEVVLSDRDKMLNSIAEKTAELRATENDEQEEDEAEETETETEEEEADKSTDEEDTESEQSVEEEFVTVKIDGEEKQVPLSEIRDAGVRTFQKESTADKRLQDASERDKELDAREAYLAGMLHQQPVATQEAQPSVDVDVKRLTAALQYGTEDEAEAAMQEVLQRAQGPQAPNMDSMLAAVDAKLETASILSKLNNSEENGGYQDIMEDENMTLIARQRIDLKIQERQKQTGRLMPAKWDDYVEVFDGLRDWKKKFAPAPDQAVDVKERTARKKKVDTVKTSSARVEIKEEKTQTNSDIINEMRKQRP